MIDDVVRVLEFVFAMPRRARSLFDWPDLRAERERRLRTEVVRANEEIAALDTTRRDESDKPAGT